VTTIIVEGMDPPRAELSYDYVGLIMGEVHVGA
jgi:hypothetical protein